MTQFKKSTLISVLIACLFSSGCLPPTPIGMAFHDWDKAKTYETVDQL